jgi:hypothetical protein
MNGSWKYQGVSWVRKSPSSVRESLTHSLRLRPSCGRSCTQGADPVTPSDGSYTGKMTQLAGKPICVLCHVIGGTAAASKDLCKVGFLRSCALGRAMLSRRS